MADATIIWSGGAAAVAETHTVTPANPNTSDVYFIKLEDWQGLTHSISFTVAATETVAAVTEGLTAAAAAAKTGGADAWSGVIVADDTTHITIVSDTAGNGFTVTTSVTDGAGGTAPTLTDATTTANAGPNLFGAAENFVGDTLYAAGDNVIIPSGATDDIYGMDASATKLKSFTIEEGCNINIGSLNKKLQLDMTYSATAYPVVTYGTGSLFLDIDNYSYIDIRDAGSGNPAAGTYALNLVGTTASAEGAIYVRAGAGNSISLAGNAGETLEAESVSVWSGVVQIGTVVDNAASTLPLVTIEGGVASLKSAAHTVNANGGTLTRSGVSAIDTALNVDGGTVIDNGSGTILLVNIFGKGTINARANAVGVSYTACELWSGASILDSFKKITFTDGINLNRCSLSDVTLDLGTNLKITRAPVS